MSTKEMPIEEKYNQIFNYYILENAISYSYHKGHGTLKKWLDYTLEAYMGLMGPMFEMMKGLPPEQIASQLIYMQQMMQPLSEIEVDWVSDKEAVMRFKNCEILRRSREIVEKAGLDIDPKFFCEMDKYRHAHPLHPAKASGIELAGLEENGCTWTFKLK